MSRLLKLLCPSAFVESVPMIDIAELKRRGINVLLTDLDNTLVPWRSYDIAPETVTWINDAAKQGMKLCIVSNTRAGKRLRELAASLGIPCVKRGLKPRRGGFRQALELLRAQPEHAAVIGDQLFTDILGGNRLGLYTVLVRPLHHREFIGTKVSRFFERMVLRLLERRGMICRLGVESPRLGEQLDKGDSQMKLGQ